MAVATVAVAVGTVVGPMLERLDERIAARYASLGILLFRLGLVTSAIGLFAVLVWRRA